MLSLAVSVKSCPSPRNHFYAIKKVMAIMETITLEGPVLQPCLEPYTWNLIKTWDQYCQNWKSKKMSNNNTNKLVRGGAVVSFPSGRCFTCKARTGQMGSLWSCEDGAAPSFNLHSPILSFSSCNCLQNHYSKYQNTTEATGESTWNTSGPQTNPFISLPFSPQRFWLHSLIM